MKVKFKGQPNLLVRTKTTQLYNNKVDYKPLFRFDDNGEYITEDEKLIKKLKGRFDHVEIKEDEIIPKEEEKPSELITEPVSDISELSYNELRKLAKEKGIELHRPSKKQILEALEGL
jgi:hypothetical protein